MYKLVPTRLPVQRWFIYFVLFFFLSFFGPWMFVRTYNHDEITVWSSFIRNNQRNRITSSQYIYILCPAVEADIYRIYIFFLLLFFSLERKQRQGWYCLLLSSLYQCGYTTDQLLFSGSFAESILGNCAAIPSFLRCTRSRFEKPLNRK